MDSGKYLVFRNVDTAVFVVTDFVRRATDRRDGCILRVIRKSGGRGGRRFILWSRCRLDVGEMCGPISISPSPSDAAMSGNASPSGGESGGSSQRRGRLPLRGRPASPSRKAAHSLEELQIRCW